MPFVSVATWAPPANRTVLVRIGSVFVFAAFYKGHWIQIPREEKLGGEPDAWFVKVALKGMLVEPDRRACEPPKRVPKNPQDGQTLLFDDSETLAVIVRREG